MTPVITRSAEGTAHELGSRGGEKHGLMITPRRAAHDAPLRWVTRGAPLVTCESSQAELEDDSHPYGHRIAVAIRAGLEQPGTRSAEGAVVEAELRIE